MIEYTIKGGKYPGDAFKLADGGWATLRFAAEKAAENYHFEHDGWEDSGWPMLFTIYKDGEAVGSMDVDRGIVPQFIAMKPAP